MNSYRKRFVQFNMLLIGIVLTIMIGIVGIYMGNKYYADLRSTMEQVVMPLQRFSQPPSSTPPQEKPNLEDKKQDSNILTVFYSKEKDEYSILSPNTTYRDDELHSILNDIVSQNDEFGTLKQYDIIYYRSGKTPYQIAIVSTSYMTNSFIHLAIVLFSIWFGAMLLFLFISIQLSHIASKPLEEAMEREKQFVADASHDLKTPLSVILANNSILMENQDATVGSIYQWIDSSQMAAKRMQELITQMLKLADVERQNVTVPLEEIDVSNIAMKASLQLESLAYEKSVTLDTELIESCAIQSNEDYLIQIISSLLENALKYEPENGKVLLKLTQDKHKTCMCVQNFGTTIAQEDLPHVFDRFYRSDKSRTNETESFGLGLAITKEMVNKIHGEISVTSNPQEGTIFTVTFQR